MDASSDSLDPTSADPGRTAEAAGVPFRSRLGLPPPFLYIGAISLLYVGLGSLVQAAQLPVGLLWSQIFLFIWPSLNLVRRYGFHPLRFIRADRPPRRPGLVVGVSAGAFLCASGAMALLEAAVPRQWLRDDVPQLLTDQAGPWGVVLFIGVIVGAPLAEETVFRGCLLPMLATRMPLRRAIVWQAVLFSLIHFDPVGFLPRLVLGLAFGALWVGTGSIWASVFAHALNNGVSSAILLWFGQGDLPDPSSSDLWLALLVTLGGGASLALCLWLLARTGPGSVAHRPLPDAEPASLALPCTGRDLRRASWRYTAAAIAGLGLVALAARL